MCIFKTKIVLCWFYLTVLHMYKLNSFQVSMISMIIEWATRWLSLQTCPEFCCIACKNTGGGFQPANRSTGRKMLQHETGSSSSDDLSFNSFSTCSFVCTSWTGCLLRSYRVHIFFVFCTSVKIYRYRFAVCNWHHNPIQETHGEFLSYICHRALGFNFISW